MKYFRFAETFEVCGYAVPTNLPRKMFLVDGTQDVTTYYRKRYNVCAYLEAGAMKPANDKELERLVETSSDRLRAHVSSVLRDPAVKAAVQRDQNPSHDQDDRRRRAVAVG
jgi:hypothetical protein